MSTIRTVAVIAAMPVPGLVYARSAPSTQAQVSSKPPVIDGRLDDATWSQLAPLVGFIRRAPPEGQPVSQNTEVRVAYEASALNIAAWLFEDNPSGIVVGQTLRDASLDDSDAFAVVLDAYLDRQNAFVFGTTPAGIEYDGQVTGDGAGGGPGSGRQQRGSAGGSIVNWDGSWDVASATDERGWYAEMRIPFSTLRCCAGGRQDWVSTLSGGFGGTANSPRGRPCLGNSTCTGRLVRVPSRQRRPPPVRQPQIRPRTISALRRAPPPPAVMWTE